MEFGYLGIPNFGKVLTVAGGAFVMGSIPGLILSYVLDIYSKGLNYYDNNFSVVSGFFDPFLAANPLFSIGLLLLTLIIAMAIGAILGLLGSYPALRLREDYLGMTLLAMGEILVSIGKYSKYPVNSSVGVTVPDFFAWISNYTLKQWIIIGILVISALIIYFVINRFVNSPLGRAMRAIRDNEVLAQSYGKDIVVYRRNVSMFAGAIAALAGALLAMYFSTVVADSYRRLDYTFYPWVIIVVGGLANNIGTFIGASVFVVTLRLTDIYKFYLEPYLPFDVTFFTPLAFGIVLTLILIFRPSGLLPEKPTYTLSIDEINSIMSKLKNKSDSRKS
jgi:branched-chain amino acid transport system permease protein